MDEKGELAKNLTFEFDLIVSTRDVGHGFLLTGHMR
jgi:hypothetical protein